MEIIWGSLEVTLEVRAGQVTLCARMLQYGDGWVLVSSQLLFVYTYNNAILNNQNISLANRLKNKSKRLHDSISKNNNKNVYINKKITIKNNTIHI